MKENFGTSFEYMRILQARTTDCLKLSSYFLRTARIKQQKYLKTLTYQRLSRHTPFSTFNFMCKICVYIKYLSLCINIIKTNFTVMYLFGCQYINKLARKNVAIFVVCYIRIAYEYWHSLRFYELPSAARHRFHIS